MILYLFDIDGTLLRADGAGSRAFDRASEIEFGLPDASRGIRFGGKTDYAILDEILVARRGDVATAQERERFIARYLPYLDEELHNSPTFRVLPGAFESLDYLATRDDVVIGVATGNIDAGAQAKLRRAGLHGRFALGGYGCDSHLRPSLVARAIERGRALANCALRSVVVIGDTIHDISAARACNAVAVAVSTGADDASALTHADALWTSLHELPAWHAAQFD